MLYIYIPGDRPEKELNGTLTLGLLRFKITIHYNL